MSVCAPLNCRIFQVGVGGLLAHQVHLSVEVGLEVVHPIGQAVIVGGDVVELDFQGGQRHLAFAIEPFQGAFHQDFASGLDRFFLQHAFGNHVQHGFHGRCVQAIGQIHVESVCGGVAAEGAFHVQFRAVDVQAGVVEGQGAGGTGQFEVGAQAGGDVVGQELTVLPEQDVLVAPVEGQRGMSFL